MTSKDLAKPETITEATVKLASYKKNKNVSKGGSQHKDIEINDEYSDEILHNNLL